MANATWTRLLLEMNALIQQDAVAPLGAPGTPARTDIYRRNKIKTVETITGRPLVIYATACTHPGKNLAPQMLMLDVSDKIGFKTMTENVNSPDLDILIHSPGGYADAAETLVQQLRGKYTDIRFIVPSYAKSAATMLVMSGNQILMDTDAELGPIDPQMFTGNGVSPADAILEQFKKAQQEIQADASKLPSWMPILSMFGPSLLVDCQHAIDLAKDLVRRWLKTYMFAGQNDADTKAASIADYLSAHGTFLSHGRPIKIPDLQPKGVNVLDIRTDARLYAAIDELYCTLDILLGNSPTYKLFENGDGDALLRQSGVVQPLIMQQLQTPPQPQPMPTPPQGPPLNRQQRRAQRRGQRR